MIKICVADKNPVIYQGMEIIPKSSVDFDVIGNVSSLEDTTLLDNKVVHLVMDVN
jgi:hypothetical protein